MVLFAAFLGSEPLLLLAWSPADSSLGPVLPVSAILQEQTGNLSWCYMRMGKEAWEVQLWPCLYNELLVDLGL